jgi:putative hemolysin
LPWGSSRSSSARCSSIAPHLARPTYAEIAQAVLALVLVVVFCNQILPSLLFNRTRGRWAGAGLAHPPAALADDAHHRLRPLLLLRGLAGRGAGQPEEETAVDVEALLEAGEEEGILEESDRDLVRSAVEFGDKLVREVMTPRPEVFAVPSGSITLEEFLESAARAQLLPRAGLFRLLDNVTGIAFAHDLLQIATKRPAPAPWPASSARPSSFPKPSAATSCCARCSAKSSTCASSSTSTAASPDWSPSRICSSRSWAISRRARGRCEEPQREPGGVWLVPGSFPVDQLPDLFGEPADLGEVYEATTLGGLVSEIEGRIPLAGEVVLLEAIGLRMESSPPPTAASSACASSRHPRIRPRHLPEFSICCHPATLTQPAADEVWLVSKDLCGWMLGCPILARSSRFCRRVGIHESCPSGKCRKLSQEHYPL